MSCSQVQLRKDLDDSPYRTSGIEQFFLPELPAWANTSPSGKCLKKHSYHYFDFSKLGSVYNLKYIELLELQAQYNERLESYFRSAAIRFVRPVEEAAFFSNTLENIRGGVKTFRLPQMADKVDLIWLDSFISMNKLNELKEMVHSRRFDERAPVLFSSCLSKLDINQWLIENKLDNVGFLLLTAEWLTPFGEDLKMKTGLHLEIKKIIGPNVDVRFISPVEILLPTEIVL
jgi:hypothetical protein